VKIAPVTPDRWDDMAELFERRGPRGGVPVTSWCWCMWWRQRAEDRRKNREAMHEIVSAGRRPGLIAYEDGHPIGWVAVAPREEYGQLMRSRRYGPIDDQSGIWSIVCFYVVSGAKRRGVARTLLAAALEHAVASGAAGVEAYPHERWDYMGSAQMFESAGFAVLRPAGKRLIMRYPS
jgi:GNAT superfamily N-acetyltransferase